MLKEYLSQNQSWILETDFVGLMIHYPLTSVINVSKITLMIRSVGSRLPPLMLWTLKSYFFKQIEVKDLNAALQNILSDSIVGTNWGKTI